MKHKFLATINFLNKDSILKMRVVNWAKFLFLAVPIILIAIPLLIFFGFGGFFWWPGGPAISKKEIPLSIDHDVRENIDKLYSLQINKRIEAVKKLRAIGQKSTPSIQFLVSMLDDNVTVITKHFTTASPAAEASYALSNMGNISIKPVEAALSSNNKNIRTGAAHTLGLFEDNPRVVEILKQATDDNYWKVRKETAISLGRFHTCETIKPLIAMLEDNHPEVREAAVSSLSRVEAKQVITPIIKAGQTDKNPNVRKIAVKSLAHFSGIDDSRILSAIYSAYNDEDESVRETAFRAYDRFDKKISHPKIIDCSGTIVISEQDN